MRYTLADQDLDLHVTFQALQAALAAPTGRFFSITAGCATESTVTVYVLAQCLILSLLYPLTARVVRAPQMISQPVSSIFPVLHCLLGLGELQACPFTDVVFPPLSLSALSSSPFHCALQDGFWLDLMNVRHDHTTAVCVFVRWSGLRVIRLPDGSWHDFIVGNMVFL